MKGLLRYRGFLGIVVVFFLAGSCKEASPEKMKVLEGRALGTTYTIKYEAKETATGVDTLLYGVFERVNKSMSTYIPDSDISRINRGDTTVVTDVYFRDVFIKAKEVWKRTDGKFDPTVGALVNAWGFGPGKALGEMPTATVDSILEFTGFEKAVLTETGRVVKEHPALYLDFNALAKGYTIDLIGKMLVEKGVANYLIELGGELLAAGVNPETGRQWMIAIDDPLQKEHERTYMARVQLQDRALATSGNYRKFRVDPETGVRYVHIINPTTGYPQKSNVVSVSVMAPTCMEADAYATAFMVMETEASKVLLAKYAYLQAYIVSIDGENNRISYVTEGFREFMTEMQ